MTVEKSTAKFNLWWPMSDILYLLLVTRVDINWMKAKEDQS